jgi:polyphosphate kinase
MNSLVDEEIIRALYEASGAGVRIRLNVRGICCLRPGLKGASETIEVVSIVDRFLEHSRIFHFRNGGDEEVYLASADWMERNFDSRLELLFPLLDAEARAEAVAILEAGLADTAGWDLGSDGVYQRFGRKGQALRSQEALYESACRTVTLQAQARTRGVFQARTR